ncbi:hypothetical protein ScalyP_jg8228 [Parmales sp. scaly parma]|nr:hypothetical protein ScalyP_jg8228 [Parmales sp. scaly parma]
MKHISSSSIDSKKTKPTPTSSAFLPRPLETRIKKNKSKSLIFGVDEAGRGPLAGPVVAAACFCPTNIPGITDSKKITDEDERERLYELIISSPGVRFAAAIVDAPKIDEINILQATMLAMTMASTALITQMTTKANKPASSKRGGCYTTAGYDDTNTYKSENAFGMIDGNRCPSDFPSDCEFVIKGDGKEYGIGAASIIAKVTRDRLMHEYDTLYPIYNLKQHKGYGTAAHMSNVHKYGASPIHRRTFAPLKHMEFNKDGSVKNRKKK